MASPVTRDLLLLEARALLDEDLAQSNSLHLPGARGVHRERLSRVLALTEASTMEDLDPGRLAHAQYTRALAQSAWAQDARHGAGQLSRSAQRAPTEEDCELGWQNVESIVVGAESAAADVVRLAKDLVQRGVKRGIQRRLEKSARLASDAAEAARRIVEERNHAYTFHADPGFSFGEGWYVAAAGVLAGVQIQVESGQSQSVQAERFVRDAGLGAQLVPYRSRPRANKALPWIIADAFDEDRNAQGKLRDAFLGAEGSAIPAAITDWVDAAFVDVPRAGIARTQPKVVVWVRDCVHDAERNTATLELAALCRVAQQSGLRPVLFGDALDGAERWGSVDLTLCWRRPLFQGEQMRRAQLQLFEHLREAHSLVGQVGVTSAGMDGPALMGLPTMYITDAPNPRLGRWVGRIPGYEEVVRKEGYLGRIADTMAAWSAGRGGHR